VPDLLGFLNDCERLLKRDGHLSLAIPDKRYCFDIFQGLTTTGHVLQAHADRACRPSPGVLFDYIANHGKRGERIAWLINDITEPHLSHDLTMAKAVFDQGRLTNEYIDAHVWRFVPSSFRLIIDDLCTLGEISLREQSLMTGVGFEFFATLSRDAPGCQQDRLTLAKQALVEHAAITIS
jgi:hypothetical protein